MKDVFAFTPLELRAHRRLPDRLVADGGLELRVPYRAPFAWSALLAFLAPRAIPGVESVDVEAGVYRRVVEHAGAPGVIELRDTPADSALRLRVHLASLVGLAHLVAAVRRLFDLDADPEVIDAALARDRTLRPLVRARRGLRVPGAIDPFELGVRAVLGQQVTVTGATRLAGRLVEALGPAVPGITALGLTHQFPDATVVAKADLTELGIPRARAAAITGFAAAMATGDLDLTPGRGLDEIVRDLTALRGFGDWTAQYIAMRAAGERDAFCASDLGVRRALGDVDAGRAETRAEAWRPWRAYGAMHLWCDHAA